MPYPSPGVSPIHTEPTGLFGPGLIVNERQGYSDGALELAIFCFRKSDEVVSPLYNP